LTERIINGAKIDSAFEVTSLITSKFDEIFRIAENISEKQCFLEFSAEVYD
jgi:hypothetical protein